MLRSAWQQCRFVPVELKRVFRQTDAGFAALLSNLRIGHVTAAERCAGPHEHQFSVDKGEIYNSTTLRLRFHTAGRQRTRGLGFSEGFCTKC